VVAKGDIRREIKGARRREREKKGKGRERGERDTCCDYVR